MQLPFRSAASTTARRFSGILAVSLLAAGYAVAPIPAAARDIEGLPPQCAKAGNELAKLKCGSAYYRQMKANDEARIAAAKARGAAADARGAAADKQTNAANASTQCMERVAQEAGDPKKLSAEQKAAVRAKILACG